MVGEWQMQKHLGVTCIDVSSWLNLKAFPLPQCSRCIRSGIGILPKDWVFCSYFWARSKSWKQLGANWKVIFNKLFFLQCLFQISRSKIYYVLPGYLPAYVSVHPYQECVALFSVHVLSVLEITSLFFSLIW